MSGDASGTGRGDAARPEAAGEEAAVQAGLRTVREHIAAAARAAGRTPQGVALIAVTKLQPAARILAALAAGQRIFGENRVQEAAGRWPGLRPDWPGIELHLIGPLQTNKVREAVALVDFIHSVDRPKLARALAREMLRSDRRPVCLVQVNTGLEPQKAGISPDDTAAFVAACREEYGIPVGGLMCIPPVGADPVPHFRLLAGLGRRLELPLLSMGMSADYEAAIGEGATHVRVGTAIFGARPARA